MVIIKNHLSAFMIGCHMLSQCILTFTTLITQITKQCNSTLFMLISHMNPPIILIRQNFSTVTTGIWLLIS